MTRSHAYKLVRIGCSGHDVFHQVLFSQFQARKSQTGRTSLELSVRFALIAGRFILRRSAQTG